MSTLLAPRVEGSSFWDKLANNNQLGIILFWNSGLPFNIRSNLDLNLDGLTNDQPLFIDRNKGRLSPVFNVDLRYSRLPVRTAVPGRARGPDPRSLRGHGRLPAAADPAGREAELLASRFDAGQTDRYGFCERRRTPGRPPVRDLDFHEKARAARHHEVQKRAAEFAYQYRGTPVAELAFQGNPVAALGRTRCEERLDLLVGLDRDLEDPSGTPLPDPDDLGEIEQGSGGIAGRVGDELSFGREA
jgi:hypothetical protein